MLQEPLIDLQLDSVAYSLDEATNEIEILQFSFRDGSESERYGSNTPRDEHLLLLSSSRVTNITVYSTKTRLAGLLFNFSDC